MTLPESVQSEPVADGDRRLEEGDGSDFACDQEVRRAVDAIGRINLDSVNRRLREQRDWSEHECREVEAAYRRFLVLALLHPAEDLTPSSDVDEYWHLHILDTRAYQRDCLSSLGFFLHHEPSAGADDDADAALERAFGRTQQLEQAYFGSIASGQAARCRLQDGSRCMKNAVC